MNKSPLPKVFLAVLAVISIWSLVLCWQYDRRTRQLREAQSTITMLSSRQQLFRMLVNDSAEYAKRHPAMDQLLRSINTAPHASTAPVSATKSAAK